MHISNDAFIRTTDEAHEKIVRNIYNKMYENGDVYKSTYEGWYCVPCETFLMDGQLWRESVRNVEVMLNW